MCTIQYACACAGSIVPAGSVIVIHSLVFSGMWIVFVHLTPGI